MVMHSLPTCLTPYFEAYKQWVTTKPQVIADIESTVRCMSYFTAGRFPNSSLTSELIYSIPNLLILFNDHLIYSAKYTHLNLPQFKSQIKIWLTVVEYTEALIEVGGKKMWGEKGKWMMIFLVQLFKSVMRLILIHHNKEKITQSPPIPPLNREQLRKEINTNVRSEGFTLERSGTVVRSVNASGPIHSRIWEPVRSARDGLNSTESPITRRNLLIAETLYVMKPMIHLTTFMIKGEKSWIPWTTALILDLLSLHIITSEKKQITFTRDEKNELIRRRITLLFYIFRSPFYDNCSKVKIFSLLDKLSRNVPLARFLADPFAKYLPHWQKTYFYMWSR